MKKRVIKIIIVSSVILLILFFLFFIYEGYIIQKDIKVNGKVSVGKYILHQKIKKGYNDYFSFNINGVRYKGIAGGIKKGANENIGKFYTIRYSNKFKGYLVVFYNKEVTDTSVILNAGFTKDDILGTSTIEAKEASFKEEVFAILGIKE
jgi:hypothetical protein